MIAIVDFDNRYQESSKSLILKGLEERWGKLDLSLNRDLDDISISFIDGIFLIALDDDKVIATGGAKIDDQTAEIVRMSVAKDYRRSGVGRNLLECLITKVRERGVKTIHLETCSHWESAVKFYLNYGFTIYKIDSLDTYFKLEI